MDDPDGAALALAPAGGAVPNDERTRRVRDLVSQRIERRLGHVPAANARQLVGRDGQSGLTLDTLRVGDIVTIDAGERELDADYIVDGLLHLREGATASMVLQLGDASEQRWLVASEGARALAVGQARVGSQPGR